ncbi:MAG: polysaccharide pyruvyl transferase family protein [Paludibacteraceae bacterium]|nr:polysaccharide pyruvyl transferase family protein [Paludibacteraceae bacterium]
MRAGILTAFNAPNYGTVLQCYALQQTLENKGIDATIIDYTPSSVDLHWSTFPFNLFRNEKSLKGKLIIICKFFLFLSYRILRRRMFAKFVADHFKMSPQKFNDKSDFKNEYYDWYIVGSDQMWSKKIFGMDDIYWGNFPKSPNTRLATYANSTGNTEQFNTSDIEYIRQSLRNFSAIGVREEVLNHFISGLTNQKVTTVLDPTLLLKKEAYDQLAIEPKIQGKYVLIYRIGDNNLIDKMAEIAAKKYDAKIVEIGNSMVTHRIKHPQYVQCTPSVGEFLGFFKNATCIFSRSFHGLVFSLMFRKQFYVGESDIMDRVNNLLNIVGLNNRVVTENNIDSMTFDEIDYDTIEKRLDPHIKLSNTFIDDIIKTEL